ncbi:MAG: hypothetical protein ACRYHA_08130 [Janthinobacterium lividum]
MSSKRIISAMVIGLSTLGLSHVAFAQNTGSTMNNTASPGSGSNMKDSTGAKGETTDSNSGSMAAPTGANGMGGGMGGGAAGGAAGGGAGGAGGSGGAAGSGGK